MKAHPRSLGRTALWCSLAAALAACGGSSGGVAANPADPGANPQPGEPGQPTPPGEPEPQNPGDGSPPGLSGVAAGGASFGGGSGGPRLSVQARSDEGIVRVEVDGQPLAWGPAEALPGAFAPSLRFARASGVEALAGASPLLPGAWGPAGEGLSYATFGVWAQTGAADPAVGHFFAGSPTPAAEVPGTGSATYSGTVAAVDQGGEGGAVFLVGALELRADFGAGRVSGGADLVEAGSENAWGRLETGAMSVDGAAFEGDGASSGSGHAGRASGRFYGPDAAEAGGTFRLRGPSLLVGGFGAERP